VCFTERFLIRFLRFLPSWSGSAPVPLQQCLDLWRGGIYSPEVCQEPAIKLHDLIREVKAGKECPLRGTGLSQKRISDTNLWTYDSLIFGNLRATDFKNPFVFIVSTLLAIFRFESSPIILYIWCWRHSLQKLFYNFPYHVTKQMSSISMNVCNGMGCSYSRPESLYCGKNSKMNSSNLFISVFVILCIHEKEK
jgi:hypothetical protein